MIAYLPSFSSSVKGDRQANEALRRLAQHCQSRRLRDRLLPADLARPLDVPFETIEAGFIADKHTLARFYASADVTLIPSTEETFSNTAAESVACGTPIAGFEVGAIPEIAQGVRGRTVPVNDVEALATALADLLTSEKVPSTELHRYAAKTFNGEIIGRHYVRFFEELCAVAKTKVERRVHAGAYREKVGERFDILLHQYRERRSKERSAEREVLRLERRSLRGRVSVIARAARLFLSDNRAFWRQVWRLLSEGR